MYQYSNSLIRQFPSAVTGNAAVGVQATVYVGETGTKASLFESNGTTPKSNPVTTDDKGFYSFSVADGDYRIVFSSSQFATLRISVLDGAQIREEFDDLVASNLAFRNEQQAAYDAFVLSQGWDQVGTFAAGFTFTSPNQVGQDSSGNWWRWNGSFPKLVTAGTLPSSDANYKLVGDGVLRNDLAAGTANVGGLQSGQLAYRVRNIEDYGADMTGATPSAFVCIAAQADVDYIVVPPGILNLSDDTVTLLANKTWIFQGTKIIQSAAANKRMFEGINANGVAMLGKATFFGTATLADINGALPTSDEVGLYVESCADLIVGDFTFRLFKKAGLHLAGALPPIVQPSGGYTYGERGRYGSLGFYGNIRGLLAEANNGGEYNNFGICDFANNNIGLEVAAGNLCFAGGGSNGNRVNIYLKGGPNNCHGRITGLSVNHGKPYNLLADGVTEGMSLVNNDFYGNDALGDGRIEILNSKGIRFLGGTMDCTVIVDETGVSSGYNYIDNVYMVGGYGIQSFKNQANQRPKTLIVRDCKGPGLQNAANSNTNINDVAPVYVSAKRAPTAKQDITSGIATTLIFPDSDRNGDNRGAFNFSTGQMTVPAGFGGNYNIKFELFFEYTTFTPSASFVQVRAGGATVGAAYPSPENTAGGVNSVSFSVNLDTYVEAGGVIEIRCLLTGTGIKFGTLAPSSLQIKLISD